MVVGLTLTLSLWNMLTWYLKNVHHSYKKIISAANTKPVNQRQKFLNQILSATVLQRYQKSK
jgi:hypothetical protein